MSVVSCRSRSTAIFEYDLDHLPYVVQYNKRDLPDAAPRSYLEYALNRRARRVPSFEAVALDGRGVFETLNTVSRMVLANEFGAPEEATAAPAARGEIS